MARKNDRIDSDFVGDCLLEIFFNLPDSATGHHIKAAKGSADTEGVGE
jgi:hypothetical protein